MQKGDFITVETDPGFVALRERDEKLGREIDFIHARGEAWRQFVKRPDSFDDRAARRLLPAGAEMIETKEEAESELQRYRQLTMEKEMLIGQLQTERRAAAARIRKKYQPEYERRAKALASAALALAQALSAERELRQVLIEAAPSEGILHFPVVLDATATALHGYLIDVAAPPHAWIDRAAIPAATEAPNAAAAPQARRTTETAWIALGARG